MARGGHGFFNRDSELVHTVYSKIQEINPEISVTKSNESLKESAEFKKKGVPSDQIVEELEDTISQVLLMTVPKSIKKALESDQADMWKKSIKRELEMMISMKVFETVTQIPAGCKVIPSILCLVSIEYNELRLKIMIVLKLHLVRLIV